MRDLSYILVAVTVTLTALAAPTRATLLDLILLNDSAIEQGAVCLDGTVPGFYFSEGFGDGVDKWVVFQQGGGWCYDESDCYHRSQSVLGSSKYFTPNYTLDGIFSTDAGPNPDFYTWNKAYLVYCDGASFSGNVAEPVPFNGTTLYFRGARVLDALLSTLTDMGMGDASDILLGGCSAGGLATYFHCDRVATQFPNANVKCAADSGFFLDIDDLTGQPIYPDEMASVFTMQNVSGGVDADCIASLSSESKGESCIFGPATYPYIKTPFFIFNSMYDLWQMLNVVAGGSNGENMLCVFDPPTCNATQITEIEAFGTTMISQMTADNVFKSCPTNGYFVHSCVEHCNGLYGASWNGTLIDGQSFQQTLGNWYFQRTTGEPCALDCQSFACNPTCPPPVDAAANFGW